MNLVKILVSESNAGPVNLPFMLPGPWACLVPGDKAVPFLALCRDMTTGCWGDQVFPEREKAYDLLI